MMMDGNVYGIYRLEFALSLLLVSGDALTVLRLFY